MLTRAKIKTGRLKYLIFLWAITTALIFNGSLMAEEPQALTLSQAIELALQGNISLQKLSNVVYSDRIDIKQATASFLPNLTASVSASRNYPKTGTGGKSVSGSLNSGVNLFNGFYDVARLNASKLGWAADTADFTWNRQSITYATVSQFIQVVLDSEFIRIAMDNLKVQQDQLKQIEEFAKVGNRSRVDVYQQQTDLKQSELQLLQAQRNYEVSRYNLLQTLGRQADEPLQFKSLPVDSLISQFSGRSPEVSLADALNGRLDAVSQQFQLKAAKSQIRAARSGYWPTISLSASAGTNYSSGFGGLGFSDQFWDENPDLRIGLSFSLPLFDRFSTKYSVEQSKIQLANQQLNMRDLNLQISSQVQQAQLDYRTAIKQRESAHAQFEYALEALKISEERFRVGSSTYIELSQVRANYFNAAYQKASADYNLLLNFVAVHYYEGTIDGAISIFS